MREHEQITDFHQCCHAQGIARVFREHQESSTVGDDAAVQRQPIHHGAHAKFTHTVINIIAAAFTADTF